MLESPPILNILIPQGSDFELNFQLRHKAIARCPAVISQASTAIKIEQMGVTMMAGEKLLIGCEELTLASNLSPSDRVVQVTNLPFPIANGTILIGKPVDVSGWGFTGKVKTPAGVVVCEFQGAIVDTVDGRFKLSLSRGATIAVSANCTWLDYQGIDIFDLGQPLEILQETYSSEALKRIKKLSSNAYRWDAESIDSGLKTLRRAEGLSLISAEVTT